MMDAKLVEELFSEVVGHGNADRERLISQSNYPDDVKRVTTRLCKAYDNETPLLNEDFLSDIAKVDAGFFDSMNEDAVAKSDIQFASGKKIGPYVIKSTIGTGGMSVVYEAVQSEPIKRRVALKFIRPSLLAPNAVRRFIREQQAVGLLDHPNIATLYEVGETSDKDPYASMELILGESITAFVQKHDLNFRQKIRLVLAVCRGLAHAHDRGVVHRDIKPDNILVAACKRQSVPKLIDFGIAKIFRQDLSENQTVTQFGQHLGSPRYMSPEQLEQESEVDHRSDIYSTALVLFELLANVPLRGSTTEEIICQARESQPELLSQRIKNEISRNDKMLDDEARDLLKFSEVDLDWIILKALSRDPSSRYQSISEFAQDLEASLNGKPVSASKPSLLLRAKHCFFDNRIALTGLSLVLTVAIALAGIFAARYSASELKDAQQASQESEQNAAAANQLLMQLLASDDYELTTEQFSHRHIPTYETQFNTIRHAGGPASDEDRTVYGILAVLKAISGDFDRADVLLEEVAGVAQRDEMRRIHEKICSEYAETAKQRLAKLSGGGDEHERALQQLILGRCYILWGMLDDAEGVLKNATSYFDANHPNSYECLVAKTTYARVCERSGKHEQGDQILLDVYHKFCNNQELLATNRGREAFDRVVATLAESSPKDYKRERQSN